MRCQSVSGWTTIDTRSETPYSPALAVDGSTGDAIAAWVQSDGTANSIYVSRFSKSSGTWSTPQLLENSSQPAATASGSVAVSIRGSYAVVSWLQSDGTRDNLYGALYSGGSWGAATLNESSTAAAAQPNVAIDSSGRVTLLWQQSDGVANSIYQSRGPAVWPTGRRRDCWRVRARLPKIRRSASMRRQWDRAGREGGNLYARGYTASTDTWSTATVLDSRTETVYAPVLAVQSNGMRWSPGCRVTAQRTRCTRVATTPPRACGERSSCWRVLAAGRHNDRQRIDLDAERIWGSGMAAERRHAAHGGKQYRYLR